MMTLHTRGGRLLLSAGAAALVLVATAGVASAQVSPPEDVSPVDDPYCYYEEIAVDPQPLSPPDDLSPPETELVLVCAAEGGPVTLPDTGTGGGGMAGWLRIVVLALGGGALVVVGAGAALGAKRGA